MSNWLLIIVFYSIRVANSLVVKSTASTVPLKCQSYNILYRINILIGLTLMNMFIKTKQISYSLVKSLPFELLFLEYICFISAKAFYNKTYYCQTLPRPKSRFNFVFDIRIRRTLTKF